MYLLFSLFFSKWHEPEDFSILFLGNQESEFLTPKKWVRLLFEPDTGIVSIKDCVSTNDITGDGDHKLVIVDFAETQCRLKLLKGLNFITDAHLPDEPAGVVTFYSEDSQMPCVAVAIGNSLLIYRNMKPYYRCNVDPVDLNPTEISLWTAAMEKQIGVGTLVEGLSVRLFKQLIRLRTKIFVSRQHFRSESQIKFFRISEKQIQ
uniref:Bardet-Biedl syndrome 1 N-terminal domain-containing protein n=1 Tax=Panagrolaimus davidi TaxID=227884 RepID=A0A914PXV2_9BILA